MANTIRFNPIRSPEMKPPAQVEPAVNHVADTVEGPMFAHLGHFAAKANLIRGHNSNGHPGFGAVQASIAKREGVSKDRAGAILASATRKASPAAKKANPNLNKVKG